MSLINGLLFSLPFLVDKLFFIVFFSTAFLFYNQERILKIWHKVIYLTICACLWQFITLGWFYSDSSVEFWNVSLVILLSITVLLLLLLTFFLIIKPYIARWNFFLFAVLWIGYELFWTTWEIRYPMMSFGIILGNTPSLIQWYSVTGVMGGSLWIMLINFVVLRLLKKQPVHFWHAIVLAPSIVSLWMLFEKTNENGINTVSVNCKLDDEKNITEQIMQLLENGIDKSTDLIVCPEGMLNLPSSSFPVNSYFSRIKRLLLSKAPRATIIYGCKMEEGISYPLKKHNVYNLAVQCDTSGFIRYRNKRILVPFGECIPYERYLGGISAIKAAVPEVITFNYDHDQLFFVYNRFNVLPLICYELYFSNEIRKYYKEDSIGVISCVSNDYAIPNDLYYTQFMRMAKIQALTFKTPIVKSTIHGRSYIIDSKGRTLSSDYNSTELTKGKININPKQTIYAKYGHLSIFILLLIFIPFFIKINDK